MSPLRTPEREARAEAVKIAATFYGGRDGVGASHLLKLAEVVLTYIENGEGHIRTRGRTGR